MEDDVFGVVYLIETAQQFWSGNASAAFLCTILPSDSSALELEEILSPPRDASLAYLDSRLRSFVTLCATYHGKKLQERMLRL